jgi:hypothetical protein
VDAGVPGVDGEGVAAVAGDDAVEEAGRLGERLVPPDLDEPAAAPQHRRPQPVRVVVELLEGRALGAEVAGAPHVVAVTPDAHDVVGRRQPDLEATARLAQRTDAERRADNPAGGRAGHPVDRSNGPAGQVNPPGHQSAAVTPVARATGVCAPLRR